MTNLKLPGIPTQNAGCVQVAGKCSGGWWRKIVEECVLLRVEVTGTREVIGTWWKSPGHEDET